MRTYHIGFEDAGKRPYGYKQQPGLLIVHAVRNIDSLPPYLWQYEGKRETTKRDLKERILHDVRNFLYWVNKNNGTTFTAVKVV